MKKILVSLLVLAICAPAMAATVSIVDNGDATATITVTAATGNIVGLGLDVDVTGAGSITDLSIEPATFNIYPDAAQAEEAGDGYSYGEGSPIALQLSAGVSTLDTNSFAISAGMLNGEAIVGADGAASVVITITVSDDCNVCVSENALRGGIVLTTGAGEDITNGTAGVVCADLAPDPPCYTGPDYTQWVIVGEPESWCNPRQCEGDANGTQEGSPFTGYYWVGVYDLNILLSGWKVTGYVDPVMHPWIAADFDHGQEGSPFTGYYRVGVYDLNILLGNWKSDANIQANCLD